MNLLAYDATVRSGLGQQGRSQHSLGATYIPSRVPLTSPREMQKRWCVEPQVACSKHAGRRREKYSFRVCSCLRGHSYYCGPCSRLLWRLGKPPLLPRFHPLPGQHFPKLGDSHQTFPRESTPAGTPVAYILTFIPWLAFGPRSKAIMAPPSSAKTLCAAPDATSSGEGTSTASHAPWLARERWEIGRRE